MLYPVAYLFALVYLFLQFCHCTSYNTTPIAPERRFGDNVITLQGLPYDATTAMALVYGGLLALMGVLISWAAPACNNPIFAEIVPPHLRNMIYSFDRSDLHGTFMPEQRPLLC